MKLKNKSVCQKERGVLVLLMEILYYGRILTDDKSFFCSAIVERIDGRNSAPGKLEIMKYARNNTAILKLTAGVSPATCDNKYVEDNSCTP